MTPVTDPYYWSGTECLRNRLDIRDAGELERAEQEIVGLRSAELIARHLPGAYDTEHLQHFHRILFGDIYDWAGTLRTVRIHKGGTAFCFPQFLSGNLSALFSGLAVDRYLLGLTHHSFMAKFAALYGELNALHPFREGNGRTQRAFLRQLAAAAGWQVRWEMLTKQENDDACASYFQSMEAKVLVDLMAPAVSALGGAQLASHRGTQFHKTKD